MAARIKPLIPTLRERKRYVVFQVHSEKQLKPELVSTAIQRAVHKLVGDLGAAAMGLQVFEDKYKDGRGICRITAACVDHFRAAMMLVRRIGTVRVMVDIVGVSGMLKKVTTR